MYFPQEWFLTHELFLNVYVTPPICHIAKKIVESNISWLVVEGLFHFLLQEQYNSKTAFQKREMRSSVLYKYFCNFLFCMEV